MSEILRKQMPELDAVRGVAVCLVILYHAFGVPFPGAGEGLTQKFVRVTMFGWVGVDLFFVLSGFLIGGILVRARHQAEYFKGFYLRRALRILPAYFALLAVLMITGTIDWAFALAAVMFMANYAPAFGIGVQYSPLWTLAVEEHFYLALPMVVRYVSDRTVAIIALLVVLSSIFFRVNSTLNGSFAQEKHYSHLTFDALAVGVLMAIAAIHFTPMQFFRASVLSVAAGVAVFGLLAINGEVSQHNSLLAAGLMKTVIAVVFAGSIGIAMFMQSGGWHIAPAPLRFFGWISYSLYLVNVAVNQVYDTAFRGTAWEASESGFGLIVIRFVVTTLVAVAIATLSRRYLEDPFIKIGRTATEHISRRRSAVVLS